MKNYTDLFDRYKRGILEDDRIEEMNHLLIKAYFSEDPGMDPEERSYSEDLVLESYSRNELDDEYAAKFREMIASDRTLNRKFNILNSLFNPVKPTLMQSASVNAEIGKTEEEEEEELKLVLQEVIEKAHAEEEKETSPEWLDKLAENLRNFLRMMMAPFFIIQPQQERQPSPVYVIRPQVKVAFTFASLAGLAVIIWFSVNRKPEILTAENSVNDTIELPIIVYDSGNIQKSPEIIKLKDPGSLLEENYAQNNEQKPSGSNNLSEVEMPQLAEKNDSENDMLSKKNDQLFASLYAPPDIEFLLARGEVNDASEKLIKASQYYNGEDGLVNYRECIKILQTIIQDQAFKSTDTLSLIYYYLGSCYLNIGASSKNDELIIKSLDAFNQIDSDLNYYSTSRWLCALANLKLGNIDESLRLADSLIKVNYLRMGEVEELRDSLKIRLSP